MKTRSGKVKGPQGPGLFARVFGNRAADREIRLINSTPREIADENKKYRYFDLLLVFTHRLQSKKELAWMDRRK